MSDKTGAPPLGYDKTALMLLLAPFLREDDDPRVATNALLESEWLRDRDALNRLSGAVFASEMEFACDHEWLDRPESDSRECSICGEEVFG